MKRNPIAVASHNPLNLPEPELPVRDAQADGILSGTLKPLANPRARTPSARSFGVFLAGGVLALALAACGGKTGPAGPAIIPGPPVERVAIPAGSHLEVMRKNQVLTGLDVLEKEQFARLKGRRVGLIANHSAVDRHGVHILDLLLQHPDVRLVSLFSPEHGFRGVEDTKVQGGLEPTSGLPLHSLYGETTRPTKEMLDGLDVLVFDMQDIGARFYTYIATMGYCMEEASKRGIAFIVLDRPNPIGGWWFDGPIQDKELVGKFTAYLPMPIAHGMTLGELALLFNKHYGIGADLQVVQMEGWHREMFFDETNLPWANPSPNMRSLDEEILYTMVGLAEGANVSVGRGTDRPFEYLGAPWIDGKALAQELRSRNLPGLWFVPMDFMPYDRDVTGKKFGAKYPYTNELCGGVRIVVTDRWKLMPVAAGIHLIDALQKLYPGKFEIDRLGGLIGARWVIESIKKGESPQAIIDRWSRTQEFHDFAAAREKVLLYGVRKQ